MTTSEAIVLDLDGRSIEIATGYHGVGVFMTIIGARGNRIVTIPLPRSKATDLARLLRLAAEASAYNDAKEGGPHGSYPACQSDPLCFRNDGHEGKHIHPRGSEVVHPVPILDDEYLCPNCVTPWKCNGPHIPESGA